MIAWNSRSRACFAEPPAESPSTKNSSVRSLSWALQSVNLPGNAGPEVTRLRTTFLAARKRRCAFEIHNSANNSAVSVCSFNHKLNESFTTPDTNAAHEREDSFSFVWPANCGSCILTDNT